MMCISKRTRYLLCFFPVEYFKRDNINDSKESYTDNMELTGADRLRRVFSQNEFGDLSPELANIVQGTSCATLLGGCIGAFVYSRTAFINFIENNQATQFQSHIDAKRKLQDTVSLGLFRGGIRWGSRIGLFCCSYLTISTLISVYRGKSSVIEYTAAGSVTGGLFRFHLGLRAIFVGTALGAIFGTIAGCGTLLTLWMTGTTVEEIRFWHYGWRENRNKLIREGLKEARMNQLPELLQKHNELVDQRAAEVVKTESEKNEKLTKVE
ncbi:RPII140-upstream gene protein [Orussus abietinus]|uniref:RPII140-upstream gene protein n=1 Tax=Orussus abietinus TaxID=222816 RepID=UPI0006252E75|nr:RPII140-upstream gene protein [Orussus abietinus]